MDSGKIHTIEFGKDSGFFIQWIFKISSVFGKIPEILVVITNFFAILTNCIYNAD